MKIIYLVVTLRIDYEDLKKTSIDYDYEPMIHGWYDNEKSAVDCILKNKCDIYENGYYNFAVLQPVGIGLYNADIDATRFFVVDYSEGKTYTVEEIERPKCFKGDGGFGMA